MKEKILKCKNKSDVCRLLNISINGRGMKIVDNLLEEYNLSVEIFKQYKYCKNCGKEIPNKKLFCSSSCSATYNNKKRVVTEEQKEKTRQSIKKYIKENQKHKENKKKSCVVCGEEFIVERLKCGVLSRKKCCSEECTRKLKSKISSEIMLERIKNGKHKGWQSRNILSYPENFFIRVLKRNNIFDKCEINYKINKRDLGFKDSSNYFLDFYFKDKKIDLEIDGNQHNNEDRKNSDIVRDKALNKNGIIVYRIKWKSINNKKGKEYIKNEIINFLKFYKKI